MSKRLKKNFIVDRLNNISLKRKLMIIQIFCVLLPLLITDSVVVGMILNNEKQASIQEMSNIADSTKFTIGNSIDYASSLIQRIYMTQVTNQFSEYEFENALDYYNNYTQLIKYFATSGEYTVVLYIDNPGVINGGYCKQLNTIINEPWYQAIQEAEDSTITYCDYSKVNWEVKRQISIIRRLNLYGKRKDKDIVRVDMNYNELQRKLISAKYSNVVYVCDGDRIILSNEGKGGLYDDFDIITEAQKQNAGAHKTLSVYGSVWDIYVMPGEIRVLEVIHDNATLLILLIMINVFLPFAMMSLINRSFTERIQLLDAALLNAENDELPEIPKVTGADEISLLMLSYNKMASRMNNLIQNEYKSRLRRQESDIARQKAELHALHSQINPHFLFNALESIRMHSVLKNENETASMVEKLALMQRQNVEWGNDAVKLKDEIRFTEAYLDLQKYRFGNKLRYEIDMDEECNDFLIPKLTIVTFVENACVHGMEKKTSSSWIFLRVCKENDRLVIEIEDTGNGMSEDECSLMERNMNSVDIGMLQQKKHIGVLNAALRLKMFFGDSVSFEAESETGTGTMVTISIPLTE